MTSFLAVVLVGSGMVAYTHMPKALAPEFDLRGGWSEDGTQKFFRRLLPKVGCGMTVGFTERIVNIDMYDSLAVRKITEAGRVLPLCRVPDALCDPGTATYFVVSRGPLDSLSVTLTDGSTVILKPGELP